MEKNGLELLVGVLALLQVGSIAFNGYLVQQIGYLTKRVDSLSRDVNRLIGRLGENA